MVFKMATKIQHKNKIATFSHIKSLPLYQNNIAKMIISIARQCGCGALNIGKMLASHYNIPFYTRQNLLEMAQKRGILDEMNNFFEEIPADELMFAISETIECPTKISEKAFSLLMNMIGDKDCIIIGRCGNYIFKDREDLVSIFLKGNIDARINAIVKEQQLSKCEATEFVDKMDNSRARYHQYYTGLTWGNANDYDICFDCIRMGSVNSAKYIEQYIDSVLK